MPKISSSGGSDMVVKRPTRGSSKKTQAPKQMPTDKLVAVVATEEAPKQMSADKSVAVVATEDAPKQTPDANDELGWATKAEVALLKTTVVMLTKEVRYLKRRQQRSQRDLQRAREDLQRAPPVVHQTQPTAHPINVTVAPPAAATHHWSGNSNRGHVRHNGSSSRGRRGASTASGRYAPYRWVNRAGPSYRWR